MNTQPDAGYEGAFEHLCEVCGATAFLNGDEAFEAGWDGPPHMGDWGVISPRTCSVCPITGTLFWAVQSGALDLSDPLAWPEAHRATLARILNEQDPNE